MSTTNAIRIALENHLQGMDSSSDPLPPVAWPNVPFTPPENAVYLRAEFIPVLRRPVTVGAGPKQRHSGMFYVTVFSPERSGAAAAVEWVDLLQARFDASTSISAAAVTVRIDYAEAKQPLHTPPFFAIPVEIGWHAHL